MPEKNGTDDFRRSAAFLNELDDGTAGRPRPKRSAKSIKRTQPKERGLFGLQPAQAFLVSAMLFILVALTGFTVLVVTGKILLPI